jgi:hypothetical protein
MPFLRRLDLRGGFTRGIGRLSCDLGAQSVLAANLALQWDATGVAKVDVT